jgi:hypothetical protein
MKVGDLVMYSDYLAIVVCDDGGTILIKWLDDGVVEDALSYSELEVVSEHR